jgi:kinesin family protein 11
LESNSSDVANCEKTISSLTEVISKKLGDLSQSTMAITAQFQTTAKDAEATEIQQLSLLSQTVREQLSQVQDTFRRIQEHNSTEAETLQVVHNTLSEMQTTLKNGFVSWGASLTSTYSTICDDIQQTGQGGMVAAEKVLGDIYSILETILQEAQEYIRNELASLEQARQLADDVTQAEIAHLRQQNEALVQMLRDEKIKADKAKEVLMHRMSEMLDAFMNEQHSRLEVNVKGLRDRNQKAQGALENYLEQQGILADQMMCAGDSMYAKVEHQNGTAKRTRDGNFKVCHYSIARTTSNLS